MLEKFIENPTVATIIAGLLAALGMFLRGDIMSGKACRLQSSTQRQEYVDQLRQLREDFEQRLEEANHRIDEERHRGDEWMRVTMQMSGAAEEILSIARDRAQERRK